MCEGDDPCGGGTALQAQAKCQHAASRLVDLLAVGHSLTSGELRQADAHLLTCLVCQKVMEKVRQAMLDYQ